MSTKAMSAVELKKLLGIGTDSIWDRTVPIAKNGSTYDCYIADDIDAPNSYNELCFLLEHASPKDTVVLHLNTNGGYIDSAFKIIASIKRSKAKVVARLTGTVASAGTIIALSCKELEVEDFTSFMIHNYSGGTAGKGHEIVDYINFSDKSLKETFAKIYAGFLTEDELTDVIKGKDMWMDAEEIRNRWSAYHKPAAKRRVTKKRTSAKAAK